MQNLKNKQTPNKTLGEYVGLPLRRLMKDQYISRKGFMLFLESRELPAGVIKLGEDYNLSLLVSKNLFYVDYIVVEVSEYFEKTKIVIKPWRECRKNAKI